MLVRNRPPAKSRTNKADGQPSSNHQDDASPSTFGTPTNEFGSRIFANWNAGKDGFWFAVAVAHGFLTAFGFSHDADLGEGLRR